MSKEEFVEAFIVHMVRLAGGPGAAFKDGGSIEEYARGIAPKYWEDAGQREDGPHVCAEADMDCWDR